jgi:hypothetical protein
MPALDEMPLIGPCHYVYVTTLCEHMFGTIGVHTLTTFITMSKKAGFLLWGSR